MMSDRRTFTLTEAEYTELLGALELAHTAAGLVPGSDSTARQSTITEIINIVSAEDVPLWQVYIPTPFGPEIIGTYADESDAWDVRDDKQQFQTLRVCVRKITAEEATS